MNSRCFAHRPKVIGRRRTQQANDHIQLTHTTTRYSKLNMDRSKYFHRPKSDAWRCNAFCSLLVVRCINIHSHGGSASHQLRIMFKFLPKTTIFCSPPKNWGGCPKPRHALAIMTCETYIPNNFLDFHWRISEQ